MSEVVDKVSYAIQVIKALCVSRITHLSLRVFYPAAYDFRYPIYYYQRP